MLICAYMGKSANGMGPAAAPADAPAAQPDGLHPYTVKVVQRVDDPVNADLEHVKVYTEQVEVSKWRSLCPPLHHSCLGCPTRHQRPPTEQSMHAPPLDPIASGSRLLHVLLRPSKQDILYSQLPKMTVLSCQCPVEHAVLTLKNIYGG